MYKRIILTATFFPLLQFATSQILNKQNYTPTYIELIDLYKKLNTEFLEITALKEIGETDIGKPLHLFTIDKSNNKEKLRILINNGIHPGEPDGINASLLMCDEILHNQKKYEKILENFEINIIPVYNVDGCIRRGNSFRANQNGPEESGFRGNYKNLDLNRDFIKMDSKNAFAFVQIFHSINPHLLIDTHVSNGADYQYTFTYFFTQTDKLPAALQKTTLNLESQFCEQMKKRNCEAFPYVNHHSEQQVNSIEAFNDLPRYCTGYAALFNCIGLTTETHMLKPFDKRVTATLSSLYSLLDAALKLKTEIINAKQSFGFDNNEYPIETIVDSNQFKQIEFKGYQENYRTSNVTGLEQLTYDQSKPKTFQIQFYNKYLVKTRYKSPKNFIIPQAWNEVIERLGINKIEMQTLLKDTMINCYYDIAIDFDAPKAPYEGHYNHDKIECISANSNKQFYKGDKIIKVTEQNATFLMNVLFPEAKDSYFRWNFFDACLQQKEWFSDYVFDKIAEDMLRTDEKLRYMFEKKKRMDAEFGKNKFSQLYFIYKNSRFYEKTAYEIPVYRIF